MTTTTSDTQQEESAQSSSRVAVDALGAQLRAEFDEVANRRKLYEERWLRDLRQYKGVYDPEVQSNMDPKRSKVFFRVTKVKCDTIKARLIDLLFPANGEKNWGISTTATPEIHPSRIEAKAKELVAQGHTPDSIDPDTIVSTIAEDSAEAMSDEIEDQLVEAPGRPSYRCVCDDMVAQALRYGTGVLKGPLVEKRIRDRYSVDPETGQWKLGQHEDNGYRPYYEYVPVWNTYPDMSVSDPLKLRFVWQDHLMTAKELIDLGNMPQFSMDVVREYILDNPSGDAEPKQYETDLRVMGELETSAPDLSGRYRVYERWGYLPAADLQKAGVEIPEGQEHTSFPSCVWILGNRVIKAVLAPIDGIDIPYHFYFYDKDESAFFGNGVPTVMRDCQIGINSSIRMALDNSAISSGPQIGINVRALADGVDPTDIHGWKVWPFKSGNDIRQAMNVWELPTHANQLLDLSKVFSEFADELTTPRFMQGETNNVKGAGETATGLSMLMGAANINLKDLVKEFDDNITKPFIKALYHWNMKFNKREDIKGDFSIIARGSSVLIAKEVQAQRMTQAVALTDNPRFQGRVKDKELLEDIFQQLDLDPKILRDEREFQEWQQKQMVMQASADAQANVEAVMAEMEKRGVDPQQALSQMLGQAVQNQQQASGGGQQEVAA